MTNSSDFYLNMSQFSSMRLDAKNQTGNATEAVAQQFESLMMQQMLSSMRSAAVIDSEQHSQTTDFYQDMYDKQLSLSFSQQGGLGIAEMIVKQIDDSANSSEKALAVSGPIPLDRSQQQKTVQGLPLLSVPQSIDQPEAERSGLPDSVNLKNEVGIEKLPSQVAHASLSSYQLPEYAETISDEVFQQDYQAQNESVKLTALQSTDISDTVKEKSTPESFVSSLFPAARRAAQKLGISADALIAQSALETGWGKYSMKTVNGEPSHNLFGIKAGSDWNGPTVTKPTLEFKEGVMQTEIAHFRVYESLEAGLNDYVDFIETRSRYQDALNHNGSDEHYLKGLQSAGYATDPNYADKILKIVDSGRVQDAIAQQTLRSTEEESHHV